MRIFELRVDLGPEGAATRAIKAESENAAIQLMRLKFPDSREISVVSAREQTEAEREEERRIREQPGVDPVRNAEAEAAIAFRNGALIALFGLIATGLARNHGWLALVTLLGTAFGVWKCLKARSILRQAEIKRRLDR